VTSRPGTALALAGAIGVLATSIGILLAWNSYYWPPQGDGWPVSFFVVAALFAAYLPAVPFRGRQERRARRTRIAGEGR
jgi:zinc/manganese transport system permease protein